MARAYDGHASSINTSTVSDGRYIYNGDVVADHPVSGPQREIRANRKAVRRKHSTFNIVSGLFLLAALSLLYTGNVITVNQLMKEVNDLNNRYSTIVSNTEVLKAEIARKSSLDRISLTAKEELGLTNPKEPPVWFEVDQDKVDEVAKK
ncbi:MAG TPA: FtsL-like putative cell division protein [Bacteroidota bacterium]|nr:FtsL-like putative cell division protein [Bacteroidota bacterium]